MAGVFCTSLYVKNEVVNVVLETEVSFMDLLTRRRSSEELQTRPVCALRCISVEEEREAQTHGSVFPSSEAAAAGETDESAADSWASHSTDGVTTHPRACVLLRV